MTLQRGWNVYVGHTCALHIRILYPSVTIVPLGVQYRTSSLTQPKHTLDTTHEKRELYRSQSARDIVYMHASAKAAPFVHMSFSQRDHDTASH